MCHKEPDSDVQNLGMRLLEGESSDEDGVIYLTVTEKQGKLIMESPHDMGMVIIPLLGDQANHLCSVLDYYTRQWPDDTVALELHDFVRSVAESLLVDADA